jgi:TrmH family RNA methyltransferase
MPIRYQKITSTSNPVIKRALQEKKDRGHTTALVEGHRLLEMAFASGAVIRQVFFTVPYKTRHEGFLQRLSKKAEELTETSDQVLAKLSDTETPQGIVAFATYRTVPLSELSLKGNPLIVVCDGIQDPGNLGTIIRTSDAAGADAVVVLPGTCDALMPKVIRATAGSIFNLPVLNSGPGMLVPWLREKAIALLVTDAHASKSLYDTDLRGPLAFVVGNEAGGVSENLKGRADMVLRIPIPGKAESLNVATSAAVCLYEAVRQRRVLS